MLLSDDDAARLAVTALRSLDTAQHDAHDCVNAILGDGEPFVDVHKLFEYYNVLYFRKLLIPRVEVLWSPRLTLCAGICELSKDPATGRLDRIRIKLSTPLLQYRPRSDTVNTLLHEAIHAYFFVTTSFKHARADDGTGHGPPFQLLADAINAHGNYDITVFHEFHNEVDSFRTHVWQCDGPCQTQAPFFGLVKRSMNRSPGKSDTWWERHKTECGGSYTKIQEPAPTKKQLDAMSKKERAGRQKNKLDSWLSSGAKDPVVEGDSWDRPISIDNEGKPSSKEQDNGHQTEGKLANFFIRAAAPTTASSSNSGTGQKRPRVGSGEEDDEVLVVEKKVLVECPICSMRMVEIEINEHLDKVHLP